MRNLNSARWALRLEDCTKVVQNQSTMNLIVNGERFEAPDDASIQRIVESLDLSAKRIAVELNGSVVRRVDWDSLGLNEGDKIEIVHFVGGG